MDADGVGAALGADVGGGLFSDTATFGSVVGAIAMLLVDNDGYSDGDADEARVGARLGLREIDDDGIVESAYKVVSFVQSTTKCIVESAYKVVQGTYKALQSAYKVVQGA
jgi:hypothetical protein